MTHPLHSHQLRELGWRFQHHRVAQGLSLAATAAHAGMSSHQLRALERGEYDAPFTQLYALLDALDLQWTDIWGADLPPRRRIHELPVESDAWHAIDSMLQPFDIRVDKHRIHAGDYLDLYETLNGKRTGRVLRRIVTYTVPQVSLGLTPGHIAMALRCWELGDDMSDATGGLPAAVVIRRNYLGRHEVVSNLPDVQIFVADFKVVKNNRRAAAFPDPARHGRDVPVLLRHTMAIYDPAFVAACYGTQSDRLDGHLPSATGDDFAVHPSVDEIGSEGSVPPLTQVQQHEVERRLQAYADAPENGHSWEMFEKVLEERRKPLVICERIENGERCYYSNVANAELFFVTLDVAQDSTPLQTFADPHANGEQRRAIVTRMATRYDPILITTLRDAAFDDNASR